jgi:hypothetical protein
MTDLITLSNYKTAEGIQATKDDAKLELLITSVSQLVKTYCNATFVDYYTNAKTELSNINYNEAFVQLSEGPVVMSEGNKPVVSERDSITSSYTTLTQDVDYYVDTDLDCIYRMNKAWPKGPGAVKVVYKAGYATIPADLKLAVIDLITYYHKDEHKARQTIAGASIQNQSSSSQRNNVAFPDHIKRVLDLYKNF